jgi:hypothetical protein
MPVARLHEKGARRRALAVAGGQEIRAALEALHDRSRNPAAMPSGRKPLAAARTARADDPAAALRCHACAKTVSPLAHELAGLVSAFHVSISGTRAAYRGRKPRPSMQASGPQDHVFAAKLGFAWFDDA